MWWYPVVVWALLLFGFSSIPGSRIPSFQISYADKIAHTLLYAVFGLFCFRALRHTSKLGPGAALAGAAAIALCYGITDEIHQMFVPMRTAEIQDLVADVAGGLLGGACAWLGGRLLRSRGAA